jgi:CRP-like cAMP-binding protein
MFNLDYLDLTRMHERPWDDDRPSAADWARVLARFPIFAGVGKRRLRKLARNARTAEFAPGETIVYPGERRDVLYVILGGKANAISRRWRRTLRTGDYFGELTLIDGRPRSETVVARGEVHVMELPSRAVLSLARRQPALTLTLLENLTTQVRHLETEEARAA